MKRSKRVTIARKSLEELSDSFVPPPYEGTGSLKLIMRTTYAAFIVTMPLGILNAYRPTNLVFPVMLLLGFAWIALMLMVIIFIEKTWIRRMLVTSNAKVLLSSGRCICAYAIYALFVGVQTMAHSPWFESSFGTMSVGNTTVAALILAPMLPLAVFAITFFRVRALRRDAQGQCTSCGYPIRTDASELCPECGLHPASTEGRVA